MKVESTGGANLIGNAIDPSRNQIEKKGKVFEEFYKAAIGLIEQTDKAQKEAEKLGLDFVMGKTDNIHNVMIAQEKANIALQFTVQVHSKVLEAYKEIMRITL